MKNKKCIFLILALVVFVMVYETVVHAGILGGVYDATASVWRSKDSMEQFMPWMMMGHIIFAVVFGLIYCCSRCRGSVINGAKFGLLIGLLISSTYFIYYTVLPIPFSLFLAWQGFKIVETILMGVISALVLGDKS